MRAAFALLAFQVALALSVCWERIWMPAALALAPLLLVDRGAFRVLMRGRLLAFLGAMVVLVPLTTGSRSATALGVPYSPERVGLAVVMVVRSVILLLALRAFTRRVGLSDLARRVEASRLRGLGEAFALATELLPTLRQAAAQSYEEYRRTLPGRGALRHTVHWSVEVMARATVLAERHCLQRSIEGA